MENISEKSELVAELRADSENTDENSLILAFLDRGGASRATYINQKKRLNAAYLLCRTSSLD